MNTPPTTESQLAARSAKGKLSDAAQTARETAAGLQHGAEKAAGKVASAAGDARDAASYKVEEVIDDAKRYARTAQHDSEVYPASHPFTSLGIAFAAGICVGVLSMRPRYHW